MSEFGRGISGVSGRTDSAEPGGAAGRAPRALDTPGLQRSALLWPPYPTPPGCPCTLRPRPVFRAVRAERRMGVSTVARRSVERGVPGVRTDRAEDGDRVGGTESGGFEPLEGF